MKDNVVPAVSRSLMVYGLRMFSGVGRFGSFYWHVCLLKLRSFSQIW